MKRIRKAVVEGRFYPSGKSRVFEQIRAFEKADRYTAMKPSPTRIFGAVLPHAGHVYSGYQTIPFFQLLKKLDIYPETFIILHPNHSGLGPPVAIDDSDFWTNAIGQVPLDRAFAKAMDLPFDQMSQSKEHSAEVLIPYLQYYFSDHEYSILPICIQDQSYLTASHLARGLMQATEETGRKIMVLASCDFSHFLSPEKGQLQDQYVLDNILAKETKGVEHAVKAHQVSVCGYGPIMSLMEYTKSLCPEYKLEILARGHSGDISPSHEVVDYVSLIMYL